MTVKFQLYSHGEPEQAARSTEIQLYVEEAEEQAGWGLALKSDPTVSKDQLHVSRLEFMALEKKG